MKTLFLFSLMLFIQIAYAGEVRILGLLNSDLPVGGTNKSSKQLESEQSTLNRALNLGYLLGDRHGFLTEIGIGKLTDTYVQYPTSERVYGKFESTYTYDMIAIGYWTTLNKLRVEFLVNYGKGKFEFKRNGGATKKKSGIEIMKPEVRLLASILNFQHSRLVLFGGLNYYKLNIVSFEYENKKYNKKDFSGDIGLSLGLGYEF